MHPVQIVGGFSAKIPIKVSMYPNTGLLSKISAQVPKVTLSHETTRRKFGDGKMTKYQSLAAQLGVMYTVCTHSGVHTVCKQMSTQLGVFTNPAYF